MLKATRAHEGEGGTGVAGGIRTHAWGYQMFEHGGIRERGKGNDHDHSWMNLRWGEGVRTIAIR